MTWPWIAWVRDAVPDPGDPYLTSWVLWWDFHQTFRDPLNLFHANIFFPYRYALAFSEHNYGIALPLFPLFALGVRPLTVNGIAQLLGYALAGYGAFRLARTLTGSAGAGWIAGIGFAFVPYRFQHISHLAYTFAGWMPLLLEALVLFVRERTHKRAVWLGTAFLMNGLTCIHWLVLSAIPLAAHRRFPRLPGGARAGQGLPTARGRGACGGIPPALAVPSAVPAGSQALRVRKVRRRGRGLLGPPPPLVDRRSSQPPLERLRRAPAAG